MSLHDRLHRPERTPEPDLFDFVPKSVWREVCCGRWGRLRPVQKAEFIVELIFFALFIGSFVYLDYLREGNVLALILSFGLVWLILGVFFYLLARSIRSR